MVRTVKSSMVWTSTSVGTMIVLGSRSIPISRGRVQIQRQRLVMVVGQERGPRMDSGSESKSRGSRVEVEGRARVERLTLIRLVELE